MKFKTKRQYYLQNIIFLVLGIFILKIINFEWFVKIIIMQLLIFAMIELFSMACYYLVDDSGITLYCLNIKKHIKWNNVIGVIKNNNNSRDTQVVVIDTDTYIKINNSIDKFSMLADLINEKVKNNNIVTDTSLLTKRLPKMYGSYCDSFIFSIVLTGLSIIASLATKIITLSDLFIISSIIKLAVVFLISNVIAIRFLQQKA